MIGDAHATVHGLLMIADVRHHRATHLDAVAVRDADVGHRAHPDLGVADDDVGVSDVVETDVAAQIGEAHGEVRRTHEVFEGLLERESVGLYRPVDVEARTDAVGRHEERKPLDMVPMQMRDQCRAAEAAVLRQRVAPVPKTRAEIEHDRKRARRLQ